MKKIYTNMMQHICVLLFSISFSAVIFLTGCKKEGVANLRQTEAVESSAVSEDMSADKIIDRLTGYYSVTGTRTLYIGSASDSIVNLVIDLAANSPKLMTAADARTLLCDYADLGYGGGIQLGFQYVITFYPHKKTFDVQPNDMMTSLIVPGSWIVYEKTFNPANRRFHFKTKYANSFSGYDRITDETLTWVSNK